AMRRCQRNTDTRAEAQFLRPRLEPLIPVFRVPIVSMLWIAARHSVPRWQILHRQVRERQRALTPNEIFNFLVVLLQHSEVEMVEVQELANLIREGFRQVLRLEASAQGFTD